MKKYVDYISRCRLVLIVIFIVFTLIAAGGLLRLQVNPEFDIFTPRDSEYESTLRKMEEKFGTSDQIIFLIESQQESIDLDVISSFRDFQKYLTGIHQTSEQLQESDVGKQRSNSRIRIP